MVDSEDAVETMDSSLSFDPDSPDQQLAGGKTPPVGGLLSFSDELATTEAELIDQELKSRRPDDDDQWVMRLRWKAAGSELRCTQHS